MIVFRQTVALMLTAAFLALLSITVAACGQRPLPQYELTGTTMGTTFSVKLVAPQQDLDLDGMQQDVYVLLESVDATMSTYRDDSELSRFNASPGGAWYAVSPQLCAVVSAALDISGLTDGAFDVTVGPLVNLWGFGPDGPVSTPPDADTVATMRQAVGHDRLFADCARPALRKSIDDLYVDLSAIAKGFAVDTVAALLDESGLANYLVEIGGELRGRGLNARQEKWAIAIETPDKSGRSVQKVVHLTDFAMATSGDYRNYFEYGGRSYSHTIDPRTGYPVHHAGAAVTVIADTAGYADGMATALLVLGPDAGLALAERDRIAAFFLLRQESGFEERMTTMFADRVSGG